MDMKSEVVQRLSGESVLLLSPTSPEGEFIGAIMIPDLELVLDVAKKHVMLSEIPQDRFDGRSQTPSILMDEFIRRPDGLRSHGFKIKKEIEGTIFDRIDEDNDPIDPFELCLNAFREVVEY